MKNFLIRKLPFGILSIIFSFIVMTQNSNASGLSDIFKSRPPEPPVYVPFDITKKGNKAEMTFRLTYERRSYPFGISFKYKEGDQIDRARVYKLTGSMVASNKRNRNGELERDKNGEFVPSDPEDSGIPTPVRLKIFLIADNKFELIYEKETNPPLTSPGGGTLTKNIGYPILEPGIYKAEIESLRDCPELIDEKIEFRVINPKR